MKRSDFPAPFMTALIDLNSEAAYAERGEKARRAPRLLPVPRQTVSADPHALVLEPWRKNLKLYPQLYFLLSRDVAVGEGEAAADAVLGLGLGLAFSDDGIVLASPAPSPRDVHMCYWYSLYSDNSQVLSDELRPGLDARSLTLTLSSETLGSRDFPQGALLFDPAQTLAEMSSIVAFRRYDLVSLGAAAAPVSVPAGTRFAPGEKITVSCGALGALEIAVDDRRDAAAVIPTWAPREYYLNRG